VQWRDQPWIQQLTYVPRSLAHGSLQPASCGLSQPVSLIQVSYPS
jgi:hypothetical protein